MAGIGAPWQLDCENVEQRCGYLLTSGLWSDCTFMIGSEGNQREVIQAHKLVLAMASPVFEAMFYGGLSERNDPIVSIPDVEPEAFRALLQYMYTGNINVESLDMACDLWYAAKKYMLPHLLKICKNYVCSVVGPSNACRMYELASLFDEKTVMDKCLQIIITNTIEVLNDPSFDDVELNTVIKVCSLDHLTVDSELELFYAVRRYAEAQHRRKRQITPPKVLLPSIETCSQTSPALELDSKPQTEVTRLEPTVDRDILKDEPSFHSAEPSFHSAEPSIHSAEPSFHSAEPSIHSAEPSFHSAEPSIHSAEPSIHSAVQQIRFLSLSAAQFAEGPARSALLTGAQSYAVLKNILSAECGVPMPTGFSQSRQRRRPRSDPVYEGRIAKPRPKPSIESLGAGGAATKLTTLAEIVRGLLSSERETLEDAARAARRVTCASAEGTERITQLVAAGGIPPLVHALHHPWTGVQYDAAWALTNIACAEEHVPALIRTSDAWDEDKDAGGAVPALVALLWRGGAVAEQAAWALGNIAGTRSGRVAVLNAGAPSALLPHMLPRTASATLLTYVRTYRLLCQSDGHVPQDSRPLAPALPYMEKILGLADQLVLTEACWVLYHLAYDAGDHLRLYTASLAARLSALMGAAAPSVQFAALAAVASMLCTSQLADMCLDAGCLNHIITFLKCGKSAFVEYAAWGACQLFSGAPQHIQLALDKGVLEALVPALTEGDDACKSDAVSAIQYFCGSGSAAQLGELTASAALEPYCRLITDGSLRYRVLEGLANLLTRIEEYKPDLVRRLRQLGVPRDLSTLQQGDNEYYRERADLLLTHFTDELDDDDDDEQSKKVGSQFRRTVDLSH